MKVSKVTATESQTTATLDLTEELTGLSRSQRKEVMDQIGELLVEQSLKSIASQMSPIDGHGRFAKLSPEYAKEKMAETGSKAANLDLSGTMIEETDFKVIGNTKLEIGVYGDAAPRADGHNNLSGDSNLPLRRFIPGRGEQYKSDIMQMIQDTVSYYKGDNINISKNELKKVQDSSDLYALLSDLFGSELTKSELKNYALGSNIVSILSDEDLLNLL